MDTTWDKLHEMFLRTKQTEGYSVHTTDWHRKTWARFRRYFPGEDITKTVLREFQLHMLEKQKPVSVKTLLVSLRTFFNWCVFEELTDTNPARGVKAPRVNHEHKASLNDKTMLALLGAATTTRDKAILTMLLDLGIRSREVRELRAESVNLEELTVLLAQTKGRTFRSLPISPGAARVLRKWARERDKTVSWFFYAQGKRNGLGEPLTSSALIQLVRRCAKRAGIKAYPHLLRHSFARHFIASGGSVAALKQFMGHKSLAITDRYVTLHFDDLAKSHHSIMDRSTK